MTGLRWTGELGNGEDHHARSPDTFEIPDEHERRTLTPGARVKLMFPVRDSPGTPGAEWVETERMWVEVAEVTEHGYIGKLINHPAFIEGLDYGDTVAFRPENVIGISAR